MGRLRYQGQSGERVRYGTSAISLKLNFTQARNIRAASALTQSAQTAARNVPMPVPSSRRTVLQLGGAAALSNFPGIGVAAAVVGTLPARRYLTADEAAFVTAACDRIIPPDPPGPGAVEVGCVAFIDGQLAGAFGSGARLYRLGPFHDGLQEQGYQLRYTPAELYRLAIGQIDEHVRSQQGAEAFAGLNWNEQDELLSRLLGAADEFRPWGQPFGEMLLRNTVQGYFADPIYGGNRDMAAWRMLGFPGAYAQYVEFVDAHDRPFSRAPMSIAQAAHSHPTTP